MFEGSDGRLYSVRNIETPVSALRCIEKRTTAGRTEELLLQQDGS